MLPSLHASSCVQLVEGSLQILSRTRHTSGTSETSPADHAQQHEAGRAHVLLAVVRLPHAGSDLLISWNQLDPHASQNLMVQMLGSLDVKDWSLFGSTEEPSV